MAKAGFEPGAKIGRIRGALDNPSAALKQIGALMVAESQQAFRNQGFGGRKWRDRAPINTFGIIADFAAGKSSPPNRRFQPRPVLRDTGRLAKSISFRIIDAKTVEVGTNVEYADVHNLGGEVESEVISEDVQKALWRWLKGRGKAFKRDLGWLLNKKFRGEKLTAEVPKRQFLGITQRTIRDVKKIVGVKIMEAPR